ncbi:MAG: triose-phosphate isomerase [Patescibacteria group bacterium]|jgi:triosephosphate isomerase
MDKQKIIIANWKMKLNISGSLELARQYIEALGNGAINNTEVVVCPSEIVLTEVKNILKNSSIKLGAQNVFWEDAGAYTGEISAAILEEAGCDYVIIGHSERRGYLLENYEMIHQKIKAVLDHSKMIPVLCIGESLKDREQDKRDYVIIDQLQQSFGGIRLMPDQQIIVAYEPIWAIGTGQIIKPQDAENMHEIVIAALVDLFGIDEVKKQFRIIYGGSVNGKNAKHFQALDNIDGFLVGGASLKPEEFLEIIKAL